MRALSVVEVPAGGGFDSAQPPNETCWLSLVWTMIKRIFLIAMILKSSKVWTMIKKDYLYYHEKKSSNQENQVNQGSRQKSSPHIFLYTGFFMRYLQCGHWA